MNRQPLRPITEDEVRAYKEDGVVCLRGMFDAEWCERMRVAAIDYMNQNSWRSKLVVNPGEKSRFYISTFMCHKEPNFLALRERSPMGELAARLMRAASVRFFYDQLFVKEPGASAITHWHHDLPYWPLRGQDIVSIWLALTPVDKASSGVEYVAGSHKWGKTYRAVTPDEDPRYTDTSLEPCPDFSTRYGDPDLRFLSWSLQPGDVVCHHPLTVHGASGNPSASVTRVGVSVRYIGADAIWDPREHVLQMPVQPALASGTYPSDDEIFPVIWDSDRGLLRAGTSQDR